MEKGPEESPEFDPVLAQQLYEGRGPTGPLSEWLEPAANLCLPHKVPGQAQPGGNVTYDIDSFCLFPSSPAVAQQGLYWQPIPHPVMNIASNVHFTLPVDCYNDEGELKRVEKSLHEIPHCCLGEFSGFEGLHLFAFFPKLALHPERTTTFLTDEQQSLWVDSVFLPALYGEHEGEDGLLQHFPASYEAAKANALAHGTEQSTYDHGLHVVRQQLIRHFIHPEKLAGLWDRALEAIESNPELLDFQGVVLYAAAKDLKCRYMSASLSTVCSRWERQYAYAIDAQFHSPDEAFVDLGKQVTARGSYLYPSPIRDG